jgi:hypothetical protein
VQRTYEEMAAHYGTTVLPARPGKARDKAKVEVGVLIAQGWIVARLRNQTFFSLDALNERIVELVEELNDRRMRVYGCSRRELYERVERAALRPLPVEPFVYGEWKTARVNIDYHVDVEHHSYSVPHALIHERVDVRVAAMTVEIFHRGQRVASHPRSWQRGKHTTTPTHMPQLHQKHLHSPRSATSPRPTSSPAEGPRSGPSATASSTRLASIDASFDSRRGPHDGRGPSSSPAGSRAPHPAAVHQPGQRGSGSASPIIGRPAEAPSVIASSRRRLWAAASVSRRRPVRISQPQPSRSRQRIHLHS